MSGWVKIHRSIADWEWYTDANTMRLFFHLLINANHKPKRWKGVEIGAGQLVTSLDQLSLDLKLSVQKIRTSLSKLKSTHEITVKSTNRFTVVTINKWQQYQAREDVSINETISEQQADQQASQQTDNKQVTTNKNVKNEKKVKKKDICVESTEVFEHWIMRMGKGKAAKLTKGRLKAIKDRIAEGYTVDDLKRAVDGCAKSKHHMGQNSQGTVYDDLTLICRSGEKVEHFMSNVAKVVPITQQGARHDTQSERDKDFWQLSSEGKDRRLQEQLEALQQSGIQDYF